MRKIRLALSAIACILTLSLAIPAPTYASSATTAAAETTETTAASTEIVYDEAYVQSCMEYLFKQITAVSAADAESDLKGLEESAFSYGIFTYWAKNGDTIGEYDSLSDFSMTKDGVQVSCSCIGLFKTEDGTQTQVRMEGLMDTEQEKWLKVTLSDYSADDSESMGQKLEDAAINTLIGMVTVFILLILISLIIAAFAFIPKLEAKLTRKKEIPAAAPEEAAPVAAIEEEELVDDTELVAVITAAIAASANTSADGLVVRSIRRTSNKWKRA